MWQQRIGILCGVLLAVLLAGLQTAPAKAATINVTFEGKVRFVDGLPYAVDDPVQGTLSVTPLHPLPPQPDGAGFSGTGRGAITGAAPIAAADTHAFYSIADDPLGSHFLNLSVDATSGDQFRLFGLVARSDPAQPMSLDLLTMLQGDAPFPAYFTIFANYSIEDLTTGEIRSAAFDITSFHVTTTPIPGSLLLLGTALAGLGGFALRQGRRKLC
jgi:hypothetical protein